MCSMFVNLEGVTDLHEQIDLETWDLSEFGEAHETLKKKHQEDCQILKNRRHLECSERRRLYNKVIELKGNIRVFCRCRPIKDDEIAKGSTSVVDFCSAQENELKIIGSNSSEKRFKFDHIFKPEDNQEAVFAQTSPLVVSVLDGFNNLRTGYVALSNEVKCITAESFPGSEVLCAPQCLNDFPFNLFLVFLQISNYGEAHETLKKKHHEECQMLKNRCHLECSKRRRLYNEVIELKGNIRVFCRCRPLNDEEIAKGSTSVVDFYSAKENELKIKGSNSSEKRFKFDHIFRPEDNQEAVFAQTSPLVVSVLDGFNMCIFVYGQTGTGKTFTMEGTAENRGVNYRTLEELFTVSDKRSDIMRFQLYVSMLEVYNEKIKDLLVEDSNQPAKKLEIKQSAEGTQEVPGLSQVPVYKTDEVWELLKSGSRVRSVGSTNANELSSRSHCLLRVTVLGENLVNGLRTRSHLWLIDLAGSERLGKIQVEGERLKESQFINKSLSALGDVISALASKTAHIPYRNSKLTHILQSSLGGDCNTIMFVQISPSSEDLGETICSLNFASRVRGIEHGPAHKQVDNTELFKYKQLAEKAKHDEKETKKLQDSLQSVQRLLSAREHICKLLQEKLSAREHICKLLQEKLSARDHIYKLLQEKVRDLENQLAEERKTRQKQENRALPAASSQSFLSELKPPLAPSSSMRQPLRRINNFIQSPATSQNPRPFTSSRLSNDDKENLSRPVSNLKPLSIATQCSLAIKPAPTTALTGQIFKPRRLVRSSAASKTMDDRVVPTSKSQSSVTPVAVPRSTGRPLSHVGSLKPKHPPVVALRPKAVFRIPLKYATVRTCIV
ncbi:hypothetical protein SSX86_011118 [Deinandra increscens subsp. villosa]|uniref:Kinesin-like protein n=1 Tax=Deinandra increscens subsp. villosa TaxID=3103831 RepID=A0AAP0DA79_9ASTR